MDGIYRGAELTIIAAAGDDPKYGLPGVRNRLRVSQPTVEIGKQKFLSTLMEPQHTIRESKWMTRGWTYQEAVLSTRRLVFTDFQVYFECASMNCCESLDPGNEVQVAFQQTGAYHGKQLFHPIGDDITQHIEAYSQRDLTYDSDVLNGISGIFRAFEQLYTPIYQLSGIPFLPGSAIRTPKESGPGSSHLACAGNIRLKYSDGKDFPHGPGQAGKALSRGEAIIHFSSRRSIATLPL